jgi:hypothetical protein
VLENIGRGERIRTSDLTVPNRALYQAEPRPDVAFGWLKAGWIIGKHVAGVKLNNSAPSASPRFVNCRLQTQSQNNTPINLQKSAGPPTTLTTSKFTSKLIDFFIVEQNFSLFVVESARLLSSPTKLDHHS